MAGHVERRANDKIYIVVDEVGASSESENISDEDRRLCFKQVNNASIRQFDGVPNHVDLPDEVGVDNGQDIRDNSKDDSEEGQISDSSTCKECTDKVNCGCFNTDSAREMPLLKSVDETMTPLECHNVDVDNDIECVGENENERNVKCLEEKEPIIKICFRDENIEKSYKSRLLKFLTQKMHPCTVVTNRKNSLQIEIFKEETSKMLDDDVLDFHLDTTPGCDSRINCVPSYGRNHGVLLSDSNVLETEKSEVSSILCFNCNGNHVSRDCPHPKDMKAISRKIIQFQATSKAHKVSRYHLDDNQKYGNLIPGEFSRKLRNALNLEKDQQPHFIYRMRLLGYPPAWLEEARVSHSGVAIYDSNGVPITEEDDEEEGEIIPEGAKDRFDISKIIEFPGFNVPLPKNMKEEGNLHGCPAISEDQSKENLIKALQPNAVQAYRKKSLCLEKYSSQDKNFNRPDKKRSVSPTIEEMEERKRQLIIALNDEDAVSSTELMGNNDNPSETISTNLETKPGTPDTKNVKNMDYGTPIFKSISPYSKLPSREYFSVNVSDVINFENLPNSTGKYETMSNLIHKIRKTVSKIKNE